MIENIRKYTGLMIVVLVLLFIGLVFLGDTATNIGVDQPVASVSGKKYAEKDFRRLAVNPLEIPSRIGDPRNPFANMLSEESRKLASRYVGDILENNPYLSSPSGLLNYMNIAMQGDQPNRFLANRIAVQKAGLEYGAAPGPDEIEQFVKGVLFSDPDGNFDQAAYTDFLDEKIGSLGIGTRGFNEYVRDLLTAQNLANLISGGVSIDRAAARQLFSNQKQSITGEQVTLESSSYENDQNPSEEDILAYWEDNQDRYNTDELRTISYVFIEPDWDVALAKVDAEKKAAEAARLKQEEDAKKAEAAAKKANEETPLEISPVLTPDLEDAPAPVEGAEGEVGAPGEPSLSEETAREQLSPQQQKAAIDALTPRISEFYDPLVDLSGKTFEELAAEQGLEITTTEPFTKANPPEGLSRVALNSPIGKLSDISFAIPADAQGDQLISEPYQTADGWFVGKLDETVVTRPLTFEEAKVRATVDLKKKLAREQLKEEAAAMRAKLAEGMAAGQTFQAVAKENDLPVQKLADLTIPPSRFGQPTIPPAFEAARYTTPGTIAEVKFLPSSDEPESALIVFVEKREVVVNDSFNDELEAFIQSQNTGLRLATFQNWLKDRYTENDAEYYISDEDL